VEFAVSGAASALPELPREPATGPGGEPTSSGSEGAPLLAVEVTNQPPAPAIPGYEILGFIGSGGQGDVYRARHIGLDRTVALKVIRDSQGDGQQHLARFRREARVIARLDHANIVRVHGFDDCAGRLFLSMEYLAGGSLKDRLDRQGSYPTSDAVVLLLALAAAVEHAHKQGIVHRDLKPGNVLFTAEGQAKIVDFGLAKVLNDASSMQTQTGAVLGSPSYMAPEQAAGKISQIGPATDVYALGAILYELIAGRPPFTGESWLDTLDRVRFQQAVPPSRWRRDVPPHLEQICLKCLEKDPDQRFPSAAALVQALKEFVPGHDDASSSTSPSQGPLPQPDPPESKPKASQTGEDTVTAGKHVGAEQHGGYQLIRPIRAGAFGEVWSAVAPGGIKAAVKIHYRPVAADAPELRALDLIKNLNHPYLLKTQAWWVEDGRLHVAMELAEGSLRGRLRKGRTRGTTAIPLARLLTHVCEAAEALDYMHGRGLIHRNITPDNILLVQGHVKIGDFSMVCEASAAANADARAAGYMAPESFRDRITPQSDQYGLAATYAELRLGRRPFPARTTLAQAMSDALDGSPDLGDLNQAEKKVLRKALAKDAAHRYPNCREFAAALTTAAHES
jgi:serine/threonine protein kinase